MLVAILSLIHQPKGTKMENCKDCGTQYDPTNVNVPNPIPNFMCATCGTQHTEQQAQQIIANQKGN